MTRAFSVALPETVSVALLVADRMGSNMGGRRRFCIDREAGEVPRSLSTRRLKPTRILTPKRAKNRMTPTLPTTATVRRRFCRFSSSLPLRKVVISYRAPCQNRTDIYGLRYRCSAIELKGRIIVLQLYQTHEFTLYPSYLSLRLQQSVFPGISPL